MDIIDYSNLTSVLSNFAIKNEKKMKNIKLANGSTEIFLKENEKEIESIELITEGLSEPYLHIKYKRFTGFNKTERIIKGFNNIRILLDNGLNFNIDE